MRYKDNRKRVVCILLVIMMVFMDFGNVKLYADVNTGTFILTETIVMNEKTNHGNTDWSGILRPQMFNQKIKITRRYKKGSEVVTDEFYANTMDANAEFYAELTHNGDGLASFVIENIPKSINVEGEAVQIDTYTVEIEPSLPYYKVGNTHVIDIKSNPNTVNEASTIGLELNTQKMYFNPVTKPTDIDDNPDFVLKGNFTNNKATNVQSKTIPFEISSKPNQTESYSSIEVPVGLDYELIQNTTSGYQLSSTYTVKTKKEEEPEQTTTVESQQWKNYTGIGIRDNIPVKKNMAGLCK